MFQYWYIQLAYVTFHQIHLTHDSDRTITLDLCLFFFCFCFLNWLKNIIISPWRARLCYRLCRIQKGQECLYTAIWVMWGRVYQWCPGELWLHAWHMRLWKHFLPSSLHRRSGETLGHLPLWFYMPCAKNTEHVNVFFLPVYSRLHTHMP